MYSMVLMSILPYCIIIIIINYCYKNVDIVSMMIKILLEKNLLEKFFRT